MKLSLKPSDLVGRKVLFIVEATTLAHVSRSILLGKELQRSGVQLRFAFAPYFDSAMGEDLPPHDHLHTVSVDRFMGRASDFRFPYSADEIRSYVRADIELIRSVQPELILNDLRVSLQISARVEKVPLITLVNAYWLRTCRSSLYIPPGRGPSFLNKKYLLPLLRPFIDFGFAWEARHFRGIAKEFGVSVSTDPRDIYSEGDSIWCPENPSDIEFLDAQPDHIHFIGPLDWNSKSALPEEFEAWRKGERVVYLNLGSSGSMEIIPRIVSELREKFPRKKLVVAGLPQLPASCKSDWIFHSAFLPNHLLFPFTDLFINNGGAPSSYPAIARSIPLIGICNNLDQVFCMRAVEARGKGKMLTVKKFSPRAFRRALGAVDLVF